MDKETVSKVATFSFLVIAFLVAWTFGVLIDSAAGSFPAVARFKAMPYVSHALPLLLGLAVFLYLQLSAKNKSYAEEVIVEVSKVVWPSKQDTTGMTVAVSIMLIISGIVLALFDRVSGEMVNWILSL